MSTLTCPHCHNVVFEDETVCPHCGAWLEGPGSGSRTGAAAYAPTVDDPDATMVDQGAVAETGDSKGGDGGDARPRSAGRRSSRGGASGRVGGIDLSRAPQRPRGVRKSQDNTAQTVAFVVVGMLAAMMMLFYGINRFSGATDTPGGRGGAPVDPMDDYTGTTDAVTLKYVVISGRLQPTGELKILVQTEGKLGDGDCGAIRKKLALALIKFQSARTVSGDFRSLEAYKQWRSSGLVQLMIRNGRYDTTGYFTQDFSISQ